MPQKESIDLAVLQNPKALSEFLQEPTVKIAEFLTGVLTASKNDWKLSAGHLIQSVIKANFLSQLGKEVKHYIGKGKIKPDFLASDAQRATLLEIMKMIDSGVIADEEYFHALKAIFFKSITVDSTEQVEMLAYEFMQIGRQLASGEILVLKAAYMISEGKGKPEIKVDSANTGGADYWIRIIADQIGHGITHLVEVHERKLIELKLIGPRVYPDQSGVTVTKHFRLTNLGYKFCEYIFAYPKLVTEATEK